MGSENTIWYINHYAGGPNVGRFYRGFLLAKEWQPKGYNIKIITSSYNHLQYNQITKNEEVVEGIKYLFLKTRHYTGNGLKRILNMVEFSFNLIWDKRLRNAKDVPNFIIVSSPHIFAFLGAVFLANRFKSKLIFEVRDIWPLSFTELLGIKKYHPLVLFMSVLERWAYQRSDHVVSLLSNSFDHMKDKGLDIEKFSYIPNGVEDLSLNLLKNISDEFIHNKIKLLKDKKKFLVIYSGAHGIPNNLGLLLKTASRLESEGNFNYHFLLFGDGTEKEKLENFSKKKKLKNVSFFNFIPKQHLLNIMRYVDVGYVSLLPNKLFYYGISPNKLMDYMSMKLPVILAIESPGNCVEKSGCGYIINPASEDELISALEKLRLLKPEELQDIGKKGYNYVKKNLNYSLLAENYLKIIRAL